MHVNEKNVHASIEKFFKESRRKEVMLVCNDLAAVWKNFKKKYVLIKAGGGLVLNEKSELLFIFRHGKWDLPKGKLDKGEKIAECALREVKEECGLKKLKMVEKLSNLYHTYAEKNNRLVLKQTTWFIMRSEGNEKLVPQKEEGISKIKWVNLKKEWKNIQKNTYASIIEIVEELNLVYE